MLRKRTTETTEATERAGRLARLRAAIRPRGPRKPRKPWSKKRTVLLCLLAAAVIGGGAGVYALFFTEEEQVAVTGTTTYGYLNEALEGSGTTTPADSVTYTISGTVLEWYVETGQDVLRCHRGGAEPRLPDGGRQRLLLAHRQHRR